MIRTVADDYADSLRETCPTCDGKGGFKVRFMGAFCVRPCETCDGLGPVTPDVAEKARASVQRPTRRGMA